MDIMSINISYEIERLLQYGIKKGLIELEDKIFVTNRIMDILKLNEVEEVGNIEENLETPTECLENILDYAFKIGILESNGVESRDLLDTKIMGCLVKMPSIIIKEFNRLYKEDPKKATNYYYDLSRATNYIRTDRVKKDIKWQTATEYGNLDITINLSKPEKDPKDIAAKKNVVSSNYPKCLLCVENEGHSGRIGYPARENHRIIPLTLNEEKWFLQYSPYVYYNEHCIVLKGSHDPMRITEATFKRLLGFIEKFPHYFVGTNADLPIVGGSILAHDHFQGGNYEFSMAKAKVEKEFQIDKFNDVKIGKVKWPMSVIRLEGKDKESILKAAIYIYEKWKTYSDEEVDIHAFTGDTPHNTVTPIARRNGENYQFDLVLRNNRTTEEFPYGIFHPHEELHHIKKENIGLIEAMGLAILPSRLKKELKEIKYFLLNTERISEIDEKEELLKHKLWVLEIINKYKNINEENVEDILQQEVGLKFLAVLKDAGVYKRDEKGQYAFDKFILGL
ncbi:Putative Galactose-1-phosphate uridylyltransferase [Clostridium chauvoei JF4335]|nr:Putative Galactose-1-phosphate uridylyltransferase [Clostridium chauvoei JF4335]